MTEQEVSNTDARRAFETLRMYCRERECGSCDINHICLQMIHGDFDYLDELCGEAADTIPPEKKNENQ